MASKSSAVSVASIASAEEQSGEHSRACIQERANAPVCHLAGEQPSRGQAMAEHVPNTSTPSGSGLPTLMSYSQTHNHRLPQVSLPQPQQITPAHSRMHHSDGSSSPNVPLSRRRADTATTVPTPASSSGNPLLPPGKVVSHSTPPPQYWLPPLSCRQNNKDEKRL